jgi:hypothetical protein
MSLNTCFDWFNKLRLYSYVLNLKIDIVPKESRAVVIRRFSLNEAPMNRTNNFDQSYKSIQTFFAMILKNIFIFFKIRQIIGNKLK